MIHLFSREIIKCFVLITVHLINLCFENWIRAAVLIASFINATTLQTHTVILSQLSLPLSVYVFVFSRSSTKCVTPRRITRRSGPASAATILCLVSCLKHFNTDAHTQWMVGCTRSNDYFSIVGALR